GVGVVQVVGSAQLGQHVEACVLLEVLQDAVDALGGHVNAEVVTELGGRKRPLAEALLQPADNLLEACPELGDQFRVGHGFLPRITAATASPWRSRLEPPPARSAARPAGRSAARRTPCGPRTRAPSACRSS